MDSQSFEKSSLFKTKYGFILTSAGAAIGLGNIWRFPYVAGEHGGAIFVLIYVICLIAIGAPVMIMEFSIGRVSRQAVAHAFSTIMSRKTKWSLLGWFAILGSYILMMFYTTIAGWVLAYLFHMVRGDFKNLDSVAISAVFQKLTSNPLLSLIWMIIACTIGFLICSIDFHKGFEKAIRSILFFLPILMLMLIIRTSLMPNATAGFSFLLIPDFRQLEVIGPWKIISAAMTQAFFTISAGCGVMMLFGRRADNEKSFTSASIPVIAIDTSISFLAGLIIFPACFAFSIDIKSGPALVFMTLPNIFNSMPGSVVWGGLFFLSLTFATFCTLLSVFESIITFTMDVSGCSRKKAAFYNAIVIIIFSVPCALGFNVLSNITPFGEGSTILDLLDFIVSNNIVPLSAILFILFCTSRYGWGWNNFIEETNKCDGLNFPHKTRFYLTYILPIVIFTIFVLGYIDKFF